MKKQILSLYNQYKHIIWPIVIGIVCIAIAVFVITPQVQSYLNTKNQITETQNKLDNLNVKSNELNSQDANLLRSNVQILLGALPEDQQPAIAFGAIQKVAATSQVNIVSLGFSSAKNSGISGASSFPVKAQVLASKDGLGLFLKNLATAPVAMSVSGIQVSNSDKSDLLDASIQIDVFYSPTPTDLGSADSPLPKLTSDESSVISSLYQEIGATASSSGTVLVPRGKTDPFH